MKTRLERSGTIYRIEGYGDYKPGLEAIAARRAGAFVEWIEHGLTINVGSGQRPRYEERPPCWVCWVPNG